MCAYMHLHTCTHKYTVYTCVCVTALHWEELPLQAALHWEELPLSFGEEL